MSAKYACIDDIETACPRRFGIKRMCAWLNVSASGFFTWRTRPLSATAARRTELAEYVRWSFVRSNGTYGYRRVHADLAARGVPIGLDLVRQLMTEADRVACQPRPFRVTTVAGGGQGAQDLCRRDFTATAPGTKLVGDITYIHTWEGFAHLATVIDCYSKAVIGWSVAAHMRTSLVTDALDMARRNHTIAPECIFHSDRGTQHTSQKVYEYLEAAGIRGSMGRTGVCWDNALAESFFAALKNEMVHRTTFPTIRHATKAVARYIETFYNRQRLHSGLGYRTPLDAQTSYQNHATAA